MSSIIDVLNHNDLQLPTNRDPAKHFHVDLRDRFDRYLNLLHGMTVMMPTEQKLSKKIHIIKKLCSELVSCVQKASEGSVTQAYQQLHNALKPVSPHLLATNDVQQYLGALYRMRQNVDLTWRTSKRGDLYHIPFELRHNVSTQRYSIPGRPSLYLGGSLYVCWHELGKPNPHLTHAALFEAVGPVKLIDFAYRPALLAAMLELLRKNGGTEAADVADLVTSHVIIWPLLCACSFVRSQRTSPYHEEYIVPQLLLEYIAQDPDIDGIRYFSVRMNNDAHNIVKSPSFLANYVFPSRTTPSCGYCQSLTSKLHLSEPVSWTDLSITHTGGKPPWNGTEKVLFGGREIDYMQTDFYNAEAMFQLFSTNAP